MTMKPINVYIYGERTSVRLEPEFFKYLVLIAKRRRRSIHQICDLVASLPGRNKNFSSKLRVYILQQMIKQVRK